MPIGWARDGGGSGSAGRRETARPVWRDQVRVLAQTVVANLTGQAPPDRELIPTIWTRWTTAADARVCPVCGPYAGRAWPVGQGPVPPLHPNCRCARRYAFTTWQVRDV